MRREHRRRLAIAALVIAATVGIPAAAQVLPGPVIVNDPLNKVVLLQQLQQLEQEVQVADASVKNISGGGWGSTVQDVGQINSQISGIGRTVSANDPQNATVSTAAAQLQQIQTEESDLIYAQQLSDQAAGQLQGIAAGNRLQSLTIGQLQQERELMLSSVLQTETYEQQATADQMNLAELHSLDGKL